MRSFNWKVKTFYVLIWALLAEEQVDVDKEDIRVG